MKGAKIIAIYLKPIENGTTKKWRKRGGRKRDLIKIKVNEEI